MEQKPNLQINWVNFFKLNEKFIEKQELQSLFWKEKILIFHKYLCYKRIKFHAGNGAALFSRNILNIYIYIYIYIYILCV